MPRNGSGTFIRTDGTYTGSTVFAQQDANGVAIVATRLDTEAQDMADALTGSIAKDGQTTPTANLPMGGYKHTNVADATADNQYATLGQSKDLFTMGLEWKTGLAVTNNATDPDHDLDFAAGSIMDSTLAVRLTLPSAMTKKLDLPWASGTGNGGMCNQDNSGDLEADETYHDYIIGKSDGTTDCISAKNGTDPLSDTNAIADGYIYKRRVMSEQTRSGATISKRTVRYNNLVVWDTPYSITASVSTAGALVTSQSPPSQMARVGYSIASSSTTATTTVTRGFLTETSQTNTAPDSTNNHVYTEVLGTGLGNFTEIKVGGSAIVDIYADASQQFRHRETTSANAAVLNTLGWFNDITVETGA